MTGTNERVALVTGGTRHRSGHLDPLARIASRLGR